MAAAGLVGDAGGVEAIPGVVAQGLEHLIAARSSGAAIDVEHGLGHQAGQGVEHVPGLHPDVGAYGLGGGGVEGRREDADTVEDRLVALAEQGVGPVDSHPQGVVAFHRGAATSSEEPKPLVEMACDLTRRQRDDPRRGQLDGQRNAVEPPTDLGYGWTVRSFWTRHLQAIVASLGTRGLTPLVLRGGMGKKARSAVVEQHARDGLEGAVLVATSGLIGEGFDCPALDTVFLAFPIKFKGNVEQCVGRILRPAPAKQDVVVHDYVDTLVPVLARMYRERMKGYATLGFRPPALADRRP